MITLNPKVKDALIKIDFLTRYEKLSGYFNADRTPTENRLIYIDGEEVMEMIKNLGYSPQFDIKEKFYSIEEEKIGEYVFGVHIIFLCNRIILPKKAELPFGRFANII